MRIAIAQLNFHIGNFEANESKIIQAIQKAKAEKAKLIVFAELAISGYPPRDFLEFSDFISECLSSIKRIATHCDQIAAIVGAPAYNEGEGKKLFNAAYFLKDKKIASIHCKHLLPTYDVFDENRYFEAGEKAQLIDFENHKIAITICEDIWNTPHNKRYKSAPLDSFDKNSIDLHINIAASPFSTEQEKNRAEVLNWNAINFEAPIIYVNHVGAQTELIFDGNSCVYNAQGKAVLQLAAFEEDFLIFESEELPLLKQVAKVKEQFKKIEDALVLGIRDYFKKLKFEKATLGLSGGIDSALTLVLAVKALGNENVIPILMPSQFSSDHSVKDSLDLCEKLGCSHHLIEIMPIYEAFLEQLHPLFKGTEFGIAEENIQSRVRGSLLMAHTNKFGTILLNTSNKSELAVGYGTLYGDMSGGLSVLGDVYKTTVFELSKWMNRKEEIIPQNILTKAPSAELRPDQKDTDSLPEYDVLDPLLKAYIEEQLSPKQLVEKGFDEQIVKKIIRMVNLNEYKRYQAPPILRISEKAFGMGRRMPIVGKYLA